MHKASWALSSTLDRLLPPLRTLNTGLATFLAVINLVALTINTTFISSLQGRGRTIYGTAIKYSNSKNRTTPTPQVASHSDFNTANNAMVNSQTPRKSSSSPKLIFSLTQVFNDLIAASSKFGCKFRLRNSDNATLLPSCKPNYHFCLTYQVKYNIIISSFLPLLLRPQTASQTTTMSRQW